MVLITGILGQLGFDLAKELTKRGVEYVAPSLEELELTTEAGAKMIYISTDSSSSSSSKSSSYSLSSYSPSSSYPSS